MLSTQLKGSRNDWQTPPLLRSHIRGEWPVDVDTAATAANSMAPGYFGPDHMSPALRDGLAVNWQDYGNTFFFNPPYSIYVPREGQKDKRVSVIGKWVDKALATVADGGPNTTVIGLLSASTSEAWWNGCQSAEEIRLLTPRVGFIVPERGTATSPPFGAALVIWTNKKLYDSSRQFPLYRRWNWKTWEAA